MIIPRPRLEKYTGELLRFDQTLHVFSADSPGEKAMRLFGYFIPSVPILKSERVSADIIFECRPALSDKDEYYEIHVSSGRAVIHYRSFAGARNAAASVSQLLKKSDSGYTLPVADIEDFPDSQMRSFMIDPARGIIPVQTIKEILIRMAMVKYNYLHLHLSDGAGYAIKSDVLPNLGGPFGRQYAKSEIREIVSFASFLGIECIPEAEFPAHATQFILDIKELGCITENVKQSPFVMCAGNEFTYEVLEKLYSEIAGLFPGKIMHVGTDEISVLDLKDEYTWPTWHDCVRCREMCEREGIDRTDYIEIFYYMLRRVYKIVSGLGKRMMMWNDNIDISKSPDLPRDILIHFWRVAAEHRGPVEGCSMERFLEEGFEVLNSYYPETYIEAEFYNNSDDTIRVWTPFKTPEHDEKYDHQILGGEPCAWGSFESTAHFKRTLPVSIILYGDRLWNHNVNRDNESFGVAATRLLFGTESPDNFNLFKYLGGYMLPRINDVFLYREKVSPDIREAYTILEKLEKPHLMTGRLATEYLKCIDWLSEKK